MESISALGEPISLANLHFVGDEYFLEYSLSTLTFPAFYTSSALVLVMLLLFLMYFPSKKLHRAYLLPLLGIAIFALASVGSAPVQDWVSGNPLYATINSFTHQKHFEPSKSLAFEVSTVDQNQQIIARTPGVAKNVLVIVLEGIPGAYISGVRDYFDLESGDQKQTDRFFMPFLSDIAQRGQITPSFVTHNSQTMRGLYSILCGDYSKLRALTPKSIEYVALSASQRPACLPQILRQSGYRTVYMQGAPLGFMGKDQFMPAAGFSDVYGKEYFQEESGKNGWGVSDSTLFDHALKKMKALQQDGGPWFLTLLTVGTHHPYDVSDEEVQLYPNRKLAAVAKLDRDVNRFMRAMEQSGFYNETLVVITSDESHYVPGHPYGGNWGLNIALAKDIPPRIKHGEYGLIDTSASILDYLGKWRSPTHLLGRSVFREYEAEREILFSMGDIMVSRGDGRVLQCRAPTVCAEYVSDNGKLFGPGYSRHPVAVDNESSGTKYWHLVENRNRNLAQKLGVAHFSLLKDFDVTVGPKQELLNDGQYFDVPAKHTVRIELDIEIADSSSGVNPGLYLFHSNSGTGEHFEVPLPFLMPAVYPEQRLQLVFDFQSGDRGLKGFNSRLRVHSETTSRVLVHNYAISWRPHNLHDLSSVKKYLIIDKEGEILSPKKLNGVYYFPGIMDVHERVHFDAGTKHQDMLWKGWSMPEQWGTWSVGNKAELAIGVDLAAIRDWEMLELEVDMQAYITEAHDQSIAIYLNEHPMQRLDFEWPDKERVIKLRFPKTILKDGTNFLSFVLPNAVAPSKLRQNQDERVLGVGLKSIVLSGIREPVENDFDTPKS